MAAPDTAPAAPPRFIPTLDTLSDSQIAAIRKIPPYGTQPEPVLTVQHPGALFTDPARFAREQRHIFRERAVPIMPSATLPDAGTLIGCEVYGMPLIVTRARDGRLRVFMNACQHKGAKLVQGCEPLKAPRIVCPYHAWTYALDGTLVGVPRAETFDSLEKANFPLAELPSRDSGGVLWAMLDRDATPDFSAVTPELEADMIGLRLGPAHVYGHRKFRLKANWKLVLEPFMEAYHVPRLHAASIGGLFGEITRVIDMIGPHQRKVAGKIDYHPDMLKDERENIHKLVTFSYMISPNLVIITSPYYTSFMVVAPIGVDDSEVEYYNLTVDAPQTEKVADLYKRSYDLVQKVFGDEDYRAAELSQVGFSSGALKAATYGGMENMIPAFYEHVESLLQRG